MRWFVLRGTDLQGYCGVLVWESVAGNYTNGIKIARPNTRIITLKRRAMKTRRALSIAVFNNETMASLGPDK